MEPAQFSELMQQMEHITIFLGIGTVLLVICAVCLLGLFFDLDEKP